MFFRAFFFFSCLHNFLHPLYIWKCSYFRCSSLFFIEIVRELFPQTHTKKNRVEEERNKNMVSKTRKQKQKIKSKLASNDGVMPIVLPQIPKSIHDKKKRPNLKGKKKIRLGLESKDIYEGFDEVRGVAWVCPTCKKRCRVVGYCVECITGVRRQQHPLQPSDGKKKVAKKGPLQSQKEILKRKFKTKKGKK